MMSKLLISIVLPTYNGARYLDQAIRSCLDQTYTHWELIIVDDASTDHTPDVIARFVEADRRIRSIHHETNCKLPGALNTGFARAQGDYLTWTSDDNCYRPQALAEMVAILESEPQVDIVYADFTIIDETGNPVHCASVGEPEQLVPWNIIGPCFLYRRAVQDKLSCYSEDMFLAEDYDFWLRASISFRMRPLHQDLYLYRQHNAALTALKRKQVLLATEKALKRNLPQMDWLEDTMRAGGYLHLAELARERNDLAAARSYLLNGVRYSPGFVFRHVSPRLVVKVLLGYPGTTLLRPIYRRLQECKSGVKALGRQK